MKKYVISSVVLCILAAIGIAVYFVLPKVSKGTKLALEAQDITLQVDEYKKIEYDSSINEAVISFSVDNESIAFISAGAKGVEIVGKSEGNTRLIIVAMYKNEEVEKVVDVTVVAKQENNDAPSEEGESSPTTPPDEENEGGDSEDSDTGEKVPIQLIIPTENLVNCQVDGSVISVEVAKKALFSISSNQSITKAIVIYNENESLAICAENYIGNNTYSIMASSAGDFMIKIVLEGEYEFSYIVKAA